ncbi:hypothetical protein PMIN07_009931 [Paraphaeosphaeria minitans]
MIHVGTSRSRYRNPLRHHRRHRHNEHWRHRRRRPPRHLPFRRNLHHGVSAWAFGWYQRRQRRRKSGAWGCRDGVQCCSYISIHRLDRIGSRWPDPHCWGLYLVFTGTLVLDAQNDPNTVFVFQIGSTLTTATASSVILINGAQACNVFWQVGTSATLGTATVFAGNILASASISVNAGVTVNGGLFALNGAVTLINDLITAQTDCLVVPPPSSSAYPLNPNPNPNPKPKP